MSTKASQPADVKGRDVESNLCAAHLHCPDRSEAGAPTILDPINIERLDECISDATDMGKYVKSGYFACVPITLDYLFGERAPASVTVEQSP